MNFVRLIRVEAERLLREIRYYKFDQMISFFDLLLICLGIFTGMGRDLFPGQSIFYAWIGMILWRYASVGLQTSCSIVEKEIRLGTLEQLMLTRCSSAGFFRFSRIGMSPRLFYSCLSCSFW